MRELRLEDLLVCRSGRTILNGCHATIGGRTRTVLWGESGAGKSTLLGAVAGLIAPQRGTIALGPRVLFSSDRRVDVEPYDRRVGMVFQDLALWPHLTASEQVHLVGRSRGLTRAAAFALLEAVGIAPLARRRPAELSGGEQQRLAIARALAAKPEVLLLDEPFSSVDRRTKELLYRLLVELSPTIDGPTIYVTHNREDAVALAEGVLVLSEGTLQAGKEVRDL